MSISIDVPVPAVRPPKKIVRCGCCDAALPRTFIKCDACFEPTCHAHLRKIPGQHGQAPQYHCQSCLTETGGAR